MKEEIEAYVKEVEKAYHNDPFWGRNERSIKENSFTVNYGRKFAKVIHISYGSRSVHCFVEIATGNLYKSASWNQPQKNGLRGNIKDANRPLLFGDFYVR